jgi:hypothetical protein
MSLRRHVAVYQVELNNISTVKVYQNKDSNLRAAHHRTCGNRLLYSEVSGYMWHSEVHLGYVFLNACQAKQIYRSIR